MTAQVLFEKIAEARPEVLAFFAETQQEVKESPFRDEIVARLSSITKQASQFGNVAAGVGASVATGIAYNLAGDLYDSLRRGLTKSRNYRNMLAANPDLKREDGHKVRRAFEVLHQFNPDFSGNPVVAGSFVRDQAQLNELGNIQMLGNLVSARKNLSDIRKLPTPGQLPNWGGVDQEHKKQQLDKLKHEVKNQEAFTRAELKKLEHETDPEMFNMKLEQLRMQTGADAKSELGSRATLGRQNVDLGKQKLDPSFGELAHRKLQIMNTGRSMPTQLESQRTRAVNERKMDRLLQAMYQDEDFIPGEKPRKPKQP